MSLEIYGKKVPLFLRLLGCWGIQESMRSPLLRFSWGELSFRWGLGLAYSVYHEDAHINIHIGPFNLFLKVPMLIVQRPGTEDWNAHYGFSVFERTIHLNWRLHCKIIHFPWDWTHVRTTFLRPDGTVFFHEPKGPTNWDERKERLKEISEAHPYHYLLLPEGKVQSRTATIYGMEMEWRWIGLKWLPWPSKISRTIAVEFSDEVGERSGSWKGGCTGCGYEWKHGETMHQSLRRMERERRFN